MMDRNSSRPSKASSEGLLETADRWKQYLVAVAADSTVAAQLWGIVENQWRLAGVTLVLAILIVALTSFRIAFPSRIRERRWQFALQ